MFNFTTPSSFHQSHWETDSNLIFLVPFVNHDLEMIPCLFGTFKLHLRNGKVWEHYSL